MSRTWRLFSAAMLLPGMAGLLFVYISAFSTGSAPLVAAGAAVVILLLGSVALYVHERPQQQRKPAPHVQVNWASSDVCLHVSCHCNPNKTHHLDGYTFGRFRCPDCGDRFELPTRLEARQLIE